MKFKKDKDYKPQTKDCIGRWLGENHYHILKAYSFTEMKERFYLYRGLFQLEVDGEWDWSTLKKAKEAAEKHLASGRVA